MAGVPQKEIDIQIVGPSWGADITQKALQGLIVFLMLGFPVTFSLGACGLFFGFIGIELGVLPEALLQALPLRIFGIMQNDTLLAIPFFTLMGLILERSGMAEDLLDTIGQLFGPVRGGLAFDRFLIYGTGGVALGGTRGPATLTFQADEKVKDFPSWPRT